MVWDRGHWLPESDPHKGLAKGHLAFTLDGKKLHGGWHLVRMRRRPGEKHDNWLLIKQDDDAGRSPKDEDILEEQPRRRERPLDGANRKRITERLAQQSSKSESKPAKNAPRYHHDEKNPARKN